MCVLSSRENYLTCLMVHIIESRFYFVPDEKEKRRPGIRHVLRMTFFCRHARHLMKTLQFPPHFKVLVESLCLTRDRMTALLLPPLPSLSLITYRLPVMSVFISSEFYPVFPLVASKWAAIQGGHCDEPDGRRAS